MAVSGTDGMQPAIALLEFDSIAVGIEAGDAMAKRAPIDVLRSGTIHPGKYLVLVGGAVGAIAGIRANVLLARRKGLLTRMFAWFVIAAGLYVGGRGILTVLQA